MVRANQIDQSNNQLLLSATRAVKEQAYYMKRAIDQDNLREALKHASTMLAELRTSSLPAKCYYDLYMQVFQEMRDLSSFFDENSRHGKKLIDLYESVQHASTIIPRLYLLISAGTSYIKSSKASVKEILADMSELCKGVQHPVKGLFLRYYLIQMVKDVLPDKPINDTGDDNVLDSWEFIYNNFCESLRLWIRLQYLGNNRDRNKKETERHDIRILVGANLVRVSNLDSITHDLYINEVLPKLQTVILESEDVLAQQYLVDCIIQVFSDECHLKTLETLLGICMKTLPGVDLKPILTNLMNRLSIYLQQNPNNDIIDNTDVFELFRRHLAEMYDRTSTNQTKSQGNQMERDLTSLLDLHLAFLQFTITLYPNNSDYVDIILGSTVTLLTNYLGVKSDGTCGASLDNKSVDIIVDILSVPFQTLPLSIFVEMNHFPNLLYFLNNQTGKKVAVSIIRTIVENNTPINDIESLRRFSTFIESILNSKEQEQIDNYDILLVSKLIHQIKHENIGQVFQMYTILKDFLISINNKNSKLILPTISYSLLQLLSNQKNDETNVNNSNEQISPKKAMLFVHQIATEILITIPHISLDLFLQGAALVNQIDVDNKEAICFEFISQALLCFEEELSESKNQFQSLMCIIGTLISYLNCLGNDNYELIATKITQYSAKLLKKTDQCRAILLCSNMFWDNIKNRDDDRVLECVQKCVRIADSAVQLSPSNCVLFIDILEKCMYYYEQGNINFTDDFIINLITLCYEQVNFYSNEISTGPKTLLKSLTSYIKKNRAAYKNITLDAGIQLKDT